MKTKMRLLAILAVFAGFGISAQAQATAGLYDLVVGFKQTGAANNVTIDLGSVANYTAPGTYTIGNYASILGSTFTSWNTATGASALNWGAAATWKDPAGNVDTQQWATKLWGTAAGTLGMANTTGYAAVSNTSMNTGDLNINKVYTGLGTYTVGAAEALAASNTGSWSTALTAGSAFGVYTAAQFNNQASRLASGATFSASDLYSIGNLGDQSSPTTSHFIGTFALYQDGTLTFTVVPEPSTYAAILGVMTLGVVMIRRRRNSAELADVA